MAKFLRQASGYVVASGLAFVLDVGLLTFLISGLGTPYLAAATIAFAAGTLFVYWACIRHIFDYRRHDDARREFAMFLAIGVLGLGLNLTVMYLAVELLKLHYLLGKCTAAIFTIGVNLGLRRHFLFHRRDRSMDGTGVPEGQPR